MMDLVLYFKSWIWFNQGQDHAEIELESGAEKLQNEIRMERDKEAAEWKFKLQK